MPEQELLTLASFSAAVGETFRIDLGAEAGALELKLVEAEARPGSESAPRQPFGLVFLGPEQPWLPQGTYLLQHPTLGPLGIFVVPTAQDAEGTRYEAIFA